MGDTLKARWRKASFTGKILIIAVSVGSISVATTAIGNWTGWRFPFVTKTQADETARKEATAAGKHNRQDDLRHETVLRKLEVADSERQKIDIRSLGNKADRIQDQLDRARREQRWYTTKKQVPPEALTREIRRKTRSLRRTEERLEQLEK